MLFGIKTRKRKRSSIRSRGKKGGRSVSHLKKRTAKNRQREPYLPTSESIY